MVGSEGWQMSCHRISCEVPSLTLCQLLPLAGARTWAVTAAPCRQVRQQIGPCRADDRSPCIGALKIRVGNGVQQMAEGVQAADSFRIKPLLRW